MLAASAASLGCQVLALVVLFAYMRALESNELLYGYAPRTSMALFVLVAVAIAVAIAVLVPGVAVVVWVAAATATKTHLSMSPI